MDTSSEVGYLTLIIKGLVSKPDEVVVDKIVDEKGILLSISVAREDMGKVIGKMGTTAKSLRVIMHAFGYNNKQVVFVKVLEPIN